MGIEAVLFGGASLLGAGASIVGANKQSKAAGQAASAQEEAARRQEQLSREIYYDQRGLQQPFYQAGLQGLYGPSGVMNLLGMSQPQQGPQVAQGAVQQQPPANGNAFAQYASGTYGQAPIGQAAPQSGPNWQGYLDANPDVAAYYRNNPKALRQFGGDILKGAEYHYNTFGRGEGRQLPQFQPQQQATAAPQPVGQPQLVNVGGGAMMQGGEAQPMVEAGPGGATPATPAQPTEGPMTQTLRQTPGYQFMLDEQKRALENSFAARGKLLSGSAMKALQERSMGLADQTYGATVDRSFQLANIGMGSAAQIQGAGNNYGSMAGNAFANQGNAAANRAYGKANAWNAGAQGVYNSAMGGLGMYGEYKGWGK